MQWSFPNPADWVTPEGVPVVGWTVVERSVDGEPAPEEALVLPLVWDGVQIRAMVIPVQPKPRPGVSRLTTEEGVVLDCDALSERQARLEEGQ
jgi:hypothetical protein